MEKRHVLKYLNVFFSMIGLIQTSCTPDFPCCSPPPQPIPVISRFSANPFQVRPGQASTLSWSVTGASSLSIAPGPGTVSGENVVVYPSASTTYILTAKNGGGSASASTSVEVLLGIIQHPAPARMVPGQPIDFSVQVAGGTPPYRYEWRKGASGIGTNGPVFTISVPKFSDLGSYSVTITDSGTPPSSVTSSQVDLFENQ